MGSKGVDTANYPLDKVIQFFNTPDYNKKINEMLVDFEYLYKDPEDKFRVVYMEYKGTWPIANRDFVVISIREKHENGYYIATKSCKYPKEQKKGVVRADLAIGGYILEKVDENSTRVTYVSFSDVKGNIPGMVKNTYAAKQGGVASKVGAVMKKEGY